jgi:hypothetical protein
MYFSSETREWGMAEKYNYELYETFNEPNIVTYIKVKRLAWAGHLVCMNNDRTLKKSPSTETNGQSFLRRLGPTKGCRANDDEYTLTPWLILGTCLQQCVLLVYVTVILILVCM